LLIKFIKTTEGSEFRETAKFLMADVKEIEEMMRKLHVIHRGLSSKIARRAAWLKKVKKMKKRSHLRREPRGSKATSSRNEKDELIRAHMKKAVSAFKQLAESGNSAFNKAKYASRSVPGRSVKQKATVRLGNSAFIKASSTRRRGHKLLSMKQKAIDAYKALSLMVQPDIQ